MNELPVIVQYVNSGGVVALLVLLLWLGYSGRVVSSSNLEAIIAKVVREVIKELKRSEDSEQ